MIKRFIKMINSIMDEFEYEEKIGLEYQKLSNKDKEIYLQNYMYD